MRLKLKSGSVPLGQVNLPPSKSITNRLLVLAALCGEQGPASRDDDPEDIRILRRLLRGKPRGYDVHMAGTAARFITAFLCLKPGRHIVSGDFRMLERPMGALVEALRNLGAEIEYFDREGFLPLVVHGGDIKGGSVTIPGDVSSQFISALLMIGPYLPHGLELEVLGELYSEPYVDMTISLMALAGVAVKREANTYLVTQGEYENIPHEVETDWSGASYFYEWMALAGGGDIFLHGLTRDSLQGDAIVAELYRQFGIKTEFETGGVRLSYNSDIQLPEMLELDCKDFPDLVQTLACTCAGLKIKARFTGVQGLRVKETDRLNALKKELKKVGALVVVESDSLEIVAFSDPINRTINTYNDHRMAMAFAPLACKFSDLKINDEQVVAKSFPEFWTVFAHLSEGR